MSLLFNIVFLSALARSSSKGDFKKVNTFFQSMYKKYIPPKNALALDVLARHHPLVDQALSSKF